MLRADRRTDMTKLTLDFRNFANAPKVDKIFRKRNARLLCMCLQMEAVSVELWNGRLCILCIQEIRWGNGDVEGASDLILFGKVCNNY